MLRSVVYLVLRAAPRLVAQGNDQVHNELEIVVLRHQLNVLRRRVRRPRFKAGDRIQAEVSRLLRYGYLSHISDPAWRLLMSARRPLLFDLAGHTALETGANRGARRLWRIGLARLLAAAEPVDYGTPDAYRHDRAAARG